MAERKKVVIVGGGFGGLYAAKQLARQNVDITLIDKRNFHLFQPLLYQVATGSLAPGNIASPLRRVLGTLPNAKVLQDKVVDVDPEKRVVVTSTASIPYDALIVATGVRHSYFGHDEWESNAPGLKTVEDAVEMRRRILYAFEAAERESDPVLRAAWLNFVIVGGGPTGVELAGALAELTRGTLRGEFKNIKPQDAKIYLVENGERILQSYSPQSSAAASRSLEKMGVILATNTSAAEITPASVVLNSKSSGSSILPTHTVLWAAGVKASSIAQVLADRAGATLHRSGRVMVESDCTMKGRPEIFVIGDLAYFDRGDGQSLPGVAPVAMQQAAYVSKLIASDRGKAEPRIPFRYRDRGSLAVIGRNKAVMELGWFRCSGFVAWMIWKQGSWVGYLIGLIVIGIGDLAFLFVQVVPGIIELNAGTIGGPVLWFLAVAITPFGLPSLRRRQE
jgi:NADH dehydrogenase